MAGNISNYFANALLGYAFNKNTFTQLNNIYVALSITDPGLSGSTISEPSGGGYTRKLTTTSSNWTLINRTLSNSTNITFDISSGSWGTITHIALFDSLTGGNFLGSVILNTSYTITSGCILTFNIGTISISL